MHVIEGMVTAPNARIVIVITRFNRFISNNLLEGTIDTLKRIGQVEDKNITIVWIPGAYELPLTVNILANSHKYDAVIALGAIIKGDTSHFRLIAKECSSGLASVAIDSSIPVIFGVLTTERVDQAITRSGIKVSNKGSEAALTALEMINVLDSIRIINKQGDV